MSKKDNGGEGRRLAIGAAIGAAVTLGVSMLLILMLALPVTAGKTPPSAEKPLVIAAALAASVIGALVARWRNRSAALMTCVLSAGIAIVIRLMLMLLSDVGTGFDSTDTAVCVSMLCGGVLCGVINPRRKRRRR